MIYMASNSTADGRFSIAVSFELGTNLDIAQVQVQNRVAIATPRLPVGRAQYRRRRAEKLARPDDGRAPLFARQIARHAVHLQLRHARSDRRGYARRRRRFDHRVRRARLFDAGVARSRSPAVARVDRDRRHQRAAGPEHPGRFRHARSAAGRATRRFSDCGADAWAAGRSRGIRLDRHQADARRRGAARKTSPRSSWRRWIIRRIPISITIPRSRSAIFQRPGSNALETSHAVRDADGEAVEALSRPASNTTFSSIRRSSSSNRSTR